MKLKGWIKELPEYIVKAIQSGEIKIHESKDGEYQYLIGQTYCGHMIDVSC